MKVPSIGGARGIFEIFVPGVFLLINMLVFFYFFPYVEVNVKTLIMKGLSKPTISIMVIIVFGYLIGILLRLLRPEIPDKLSARYLSLFKLHRQNNGEPKIYASISESFPYFGWLEDICNECLYGEPVEFFNDFWKPHNTEGFKKQFYNFCKVNVCIQNENAASEIYSSEALTRYISGMFYALSISSILLVAIFLINYFHNYSCLYFAFLIVVFYLLSLLIIISRFRFIRNKEVETLFAATFLEKRIFELDD